MSWLISGILLGCCVFLILLWMMFIGVPINKFNDAGDRSMAALTLFFAIAAAVRAGRK